MKKVRYLLVGIILLCSFSELSAEGIPISVKAKDTLKETISLSDLPLKSVELMNRTKQAFHDLIPLYTIRKLKVRNNIILASVDTNLLKPLDPNDPLLNIRYLENRRISLQHEQRRIDNEETQLNETLRSIEELSNYLIQEGILWKNTKEKLLRDSLIKPVPGKINTTISFIDSATYVLSTKSRTLVEILEKTIAMGMTIDLYLEKTELLISRKEANVFSEDMTPFFKLDFTTDYGKEVSYSLKRLKDVRSKEFFEYLSNNLSELAFLIIFIFGMVSFFSFLSKRIQVNYFGYGKFYKEILVKVLTHPFSAAIILGLLLTLVIFPDRPIIFREMSAYIIAYPLIELMNTILNKKYHIYLHTFSVVIVLYMFLVVISQGTVIYRMILFLIALAETGLILLLIYNLRKNSLFTENQKKYLNILIVVHLVIAVCGLVANITGKITLTEIALNAVFANIFNGIILFLTLVILNGLIAAGIDSREGQKYNTFRKFGEIIKQRSILVLIFFAVFLWFTQMLHAFRLDNYIYASISAFFSYQITLGTASFSLDLVVIFFAVIFFSYFTAQFLRIILEEDVLIRLPLSKGLPHTIAMAVKYILIVAGFLLALNAAGIPMDKLTIILGAFSVGIGFGLQNIFSNMVSGLILLFERPIQLGDTVQVGQLTGDVKSIDLRSSNIRTFDGAEVIVPNGQLISNEVINWTLSDKKRRLEVEVGVAYDSDPELVRRLFMDILTTHPKVLQDPEPLVFFSSFGDSALDFVLVFWIADYSEGRIIKSDVHFKIFSILKENNITIPFPQRDVHIHTEKSELPI